MSLNTPSEQKTALRRTLRKARMAIPAQVRRQAARAAVRLALSHRLICQGRRIGLYMPAKGEFDCRPLLECARALGAICHLPIVPHHSRRKLWFSALDDGPHWRDNRFGIPEYGHAFEKVRAARLDVLFLPLLGFDERGYRMGMGGGFYDASLAYLHQRRHWRKPRLVGVAFEAQKVAHIPEDPWDVALDMVLTERRLYRFKRPGT